MRRTRENLRLLEDVAKIATGTFGSFGEIRNYIKSLVKERVERAMEDMDVVSRREFERVEAMAARARERQEELEKRFSALERKNKRKRA